MLTKIHTISLIFLYCALGLFALAMAFMLIYSTFAW
jgi:hypothetical protein